ncbi:MAG: F-type H+-transporting ATPase subunit b [Thermomicrobiales bacterium]|jgi:F-type H+-transporting ATPase subunit b|nr:F-type H+-transporting ATPase subunit b [Thermomicrobiales bacterium]MEA2531747.1 F-type H+-transporting ATPase subunit b [Thermomicrobiales bacterium]MEA2584694.1 F-type H+-transporting ATPase subunit b [Thermomicrobiales bacterium]MEA2595108.1 F-type H+-transporting ATPase subunit b [Thermomicrobiales bacterium]
MSDLGINGWNLIIQLIAFIIFIFLLWRFAIGPITRVLDQRTERVRESMEAAQRMQQELQVTAARNEEVLAEARRQAQEILGQSRQQGEALVTRAQEAAAQQQEIFLAQARATLRAETEQARQQLRQEVADLAVAAAAKIVRKELDPATEARLIQETLAEAAGASNPVA